MATRRAPQLTSRRQPQQVRSTDLVAVILQAANQVLASAGAKRFTTARVAERAGVSVGSVYQYFPNKAAILFRLQSDEWTRSAETLSAILTDSAQSPDARLRAWVHAFIASECDEAAVRVALADVAPGYRETPGAGQSRESIGHALETFMADALPRAAADARTRTGERIRSILNAAGKQFSAAPRTPAQIQDQADFLADMFRAYLQALSAGSIPDRHAQPGDACASGAARQALTGQGSGIGG